MPVLLDAPGTKGPISDMGRFQGWIDSRNAYPPVPGSASGGMVNRYGAPPGGPVAAPSGDPMGGAAGPGMFNGLTGQASNYLQQLLGGGRTTAQDAALKQRQAQQSVGSGMPNSQNIGGTLLGNSALRDERDFAGAQQATGFKGLLDMIGTYSGNLFPTANAGLEAAIQRERIAADSAAEAGRLGLGREELSSLDKYRGGQLGIEQGRLGIEQGRLGLDQGRLGIEAGRLGLDAKKLEQDAYEFQQKFGYEERKLAADLGISEQKLALELARLNAETSYNNRNQDVAEFNALNAATSGSGGLGNLSSLFGSPSQYKVPKGPTQLYMYGR